MTKPIYGLIGAGGFGREVMPLVRVNLAERLAASELDIAFVVEGKKPDQTLNGVQVLTMAEFSRLDCPKFFNIAIGASNVRMRIAESCISQGMIPFSIRAETAIVMDNCEIGDGAILCPFSILTSNVRVGRFFHANIYAYVAHDCEVGDYVTLAPRVSCNGRMRIDDHAYIGTGAVFREGSVDKPMTVGRHAVVGMGAVVTRNVPDYETVVGNPARALDARVRT